MKIEIENIKQKSSDKKSKKQKCVSELRQDLVTGDWVVIAVGRAKRPEDFSQNKKQKEESNEIESCLFEHPEKTGQEEDVLIYQSSGGDWTLRVFPNKYPAFCCDHEARYFSEGPYFFMDGTGYHEVIVTRDHYHQLALMREIEVAEVLDAYQERYLALMNKPHVNFIGIFHNHGKEAGASIAHPHSQLMAIPVISPYIQLELSGAERFYRQNKRCVYCLMIKHELESQKRVIFENEEFVAFCPFASRVNFEVWIAPKKHASYFERIKTEEKLKLAQVFRQALGAIHDSLGDPAYNFYIHTSPCDGNDYPHYHWHIEILPKTSTWAGFELETGIEISTIQPEMAAEYLRKQK